MCASTGKAPSGQNAARRIAAKQESAKTEGVPAIRARASGQTAARRNAGQGGSARMENVSAGGIRAPGRAVGGRAGAGVNQGAGEEQGAARCEEIQEPVLASAGGGTRSSLVAGAGKRKSAHQSAGMEQLVRRSRGNTPAFVKGTNGRW